MNQKNSKMRLKSKYLIVVLFSIIFVWSFYKLLEPRIFKNLTDFNEINADIENPIYSNDLINLNDLFRTGECLLAEAGKKIVEIRSQSSELILDRKKLDNSIVTKADIESHTIIVHTLNAKYNNKLKIVSEESTNKDVKEFDANHYLSKCGNVEHPKQESDITADLRDITVWIDPLDATQEYSENLTEFVTVMFCIAHKGKPKAGIIHNPFTNLTVKSFYEKKRLQLTKLSDSEKRVIVSRSHSGSVTQVVLNKLGKQAKLITAAGSGFKALALLDDKADVYFHTGRISKWDICAPTAILLSNGGKLTKRNGMSIDYSGTDSNSIDSGIIASIKEHDYFVKLFQN